MSWIILVVAGLLEVAWAYGLKQSSGLTRPFVALASLAAVIGSLGLLALSLRSLPLGTAYAVWTAIGTVGTAAVGMLVLKEPVSIARLLFLAMIVGGGLGLKLGS